MVEEQTKGESRQEVGRELLICGAVQVRPCATGWGWAMYVRDPVDRQK